MSWISQQVLVALAAITASACSRQQVEAASGVTGKSLETCLARLRRLGFVLLEDARYSVTPAGRAFLESGKRLTSGPRGPQPGKRLYHGTLRQRAWHAMQIKKKFTVADILPVAANGGERDAENNIGKYVRALARTGFLTELERRGPREVPTSNGYKRYLLTRDTGLLAPRWLPLRGIVFDPNTEEEHPL